MPPAAEPRRIRRGELYWAQLARPELAAAPGDAAQGAAGHAAEGAAGHAASAADEPAAAPAIAHPHVVVSDDLFNDSRLATVVIIALTSNPRRAGEPGNVLLEPGEGGLPRPSVVVVSQISSIAKAELGERIGELSEARVEQILDGLRFQQASFFSR